ncbi:hypothetical protein EV356DRAFT_188758 [Viridothelium virens]|uniref:STB6-like N-terminal domain-containing protein n=1 Tax=Viridothelium virens TaxID=1048519 RepID=A0A6A6H7B0_VIRVR|nr:hypothetical protein EV356DRAFT_188758 [Viridothelium virens]
MAATQYNNQSSKFQRRETSGTESRADASSVKMTKDSPLVSSPSERTAGSPQQQPGHQRLVLTDPVAFRYLEEDPSTTVLERRRRLQGYELYVVEQWACSRTQPTFVITTYTGDPSHSIIVGILSVPSDESSWSRRLKVYFKALNQFHARRKETPLGFLSVTNLSGFPSSLTVVSVPDGDLKAHRDDFFVNENLKRLGCSGRVGLTLASPSGATQAKFHQLYRTSEKIPLYSAVIELVKLCQVALVLFGKLEQEYADGLLCDITEKAISDWWVEMGTEFYNIEPTDGILGPTTVSALLGMLSGARNRLHAYGAPVAKDVFDTESTKRGVAYFQKSQRLTKTRRLDRKTLDRLHKATVKAANSEGWTVPRAVKSTMAEISGKGGEMMMEFVGGRDKAGIADVETVDIERFVQLIHGERLKWLWYGKPMKSHGDMFSRLPGEEGLIFEPDDQGGYSWKGSRKDSSTVDLRPLKRNMSNVHGKSPREPIPEGTNEKEQDLKKAVLKRAGGRLKGAVGLRSHHGKHSHDDTGDEFHGIGHNESQLSVAPPSLRRTNSDPASPTSTKSIDDSLERTFSHLTDQGAVTHLEDSKFSPAFAKAITDTPDDSQTTLLPEKGTNGELEKRDVLGPPFQYEPSMREPSIAGSNYGGVDLDDLLPTDTFPGQDIGTLLRRTRSIDGIDLRAPPPKHENWWPRHLSFSIAEPSVLVWEDIGWREEEDSPLDSSDPKSALWREINLADGDKLMREQMTIVGGKVAQWVDQKITRLQKLEAQADHDGQELQTLYLPRLESYRTLTEQSKGVVEVEQGQLQEAIKEVETLSAKLEYEINNLRSKVEDVEAGVAEFSDQVTNVEDRVKELEGDRKAREGWAGWMWRLSTGMQLRDRGAFERNS